MHQEHNNPIRIMKRNLRLINRVTVQSPFVIVTVFVVIYTILLGAANSAQAQECSADPTPSVIIDAQGTTESIQLNGDAGCGITIFSYPSWLFPPDPQGTYILVSATANTGAPRTGTLHFYFGGKPYYVTLTQAGLPPLITTQPVNRTACSPSSLSVTFSVTASYANSYQWQQSTNGGASFTGITGATSSSYSFTATTSMNNYRYRCIVSNLSGNVTSSAAILTVAQVTQVGSVTSQTVCSNAPSATFHIGATGTNLSFQWRKSMNGGAFVDLLTGDSGYEGVTTNALIVKDVNENANARFACFVSGTCSGGGLSSAGTLFVSSANPSFSQPSNQLICPGEEATFVVSSSNATSFLWEEKTAASSSFVPIGGANSNTLKFSPSQDKAGAQYRCLIGGPCGSSATSQPATLEFHTMSAVITNQPLNQTVCEQEPVTFQIQVSDPNVRYQWEVSANSGVSYNEIPGATQSSYSLLAINALNGNRYRVKVRHPLCNTFLTSMNAALTVKPNLALSASLSASSTSVNVGEDVHLTISPTSPGAGRTWEWYVLSGNIKIIIGTGSATTVNVNTSKTYFVNANSCKENGQSILITAIERFPDQNYIHIVQPKVPMNATTAINEDNAIEQITYYDGLGRPMQTIGIKASPNKSDVITPIVYDEYGREQRKYLPFVSGNDGGYRQLTSIIGPDHNYLGIASTTYGSEDDSRIANDSRPYSQTFFEASPLNRPQREYGPGIAWAPEGQGSNNKFIEHRYLSNIHSLEGSQFAESIIAWSVNESGALSRKTPLQHYIVSGGYFDSNQLFVKVTVDEHGNSVREYTDKQGRVILKKVQVVAKPNPNNINLNDPEEWASTYYIYDDFGNLRIVLPPEGVKNYLQFTQ